MRDGLEKAIKDLTLAVSQLTVAQHVAAGGNHAASHEDELDREEDERITLLEGIIVMIDQQLIERKGFTLESIFIGHQLKSTVNQILMSNAGDV